jgi:hypothetical protein
MASPSRNDDRDERNSDERPPVVLAHDDIAMQQRSR